MNSSGKLLFLLATVFITACSEKHLISNKEYFGDVEKAFSGKELLAENRSEALFDVFKKDLSTQQREALKFMFAFMPLNDLADYDGEFFLDNINIALSSKNSSPWRKRIPEDIFLHYVLPVRVNNENLDSFRIKYYDEIFERIRNMNLMESALEINHWCHEKVTYQLSDIRTSAPLSTILSARGRCGEESTFTVAALRTAGIPARQVYTPRWAHSDDNHAWVEFWVDGKWYYMGACEPEPVPDRGWFTEPARRAMLVHTKSFGTYLGNENAINRYKNFTEVNNLSKYAVTKKIFVKVLDRMGNPVKDAMVEYMLYNYAEFFPLSVVPANEKGISSFETGLGDLLIWARKENDFNYKKISVNETDTLILTLDKNGESNYSLDIDLSVPVANAPFDGPSAELLLKNSERINKENNIRQKYIDSWMDQDDVKTFAIQIKEDTTPIKEIIAESMGNYLEIKSFLLSTTDSLRPLAISLLKVLTDKDLRDTKAFILSDHLKNSIGFEKQYNVKDTGIFFNYVLNPRIANEMLVGYRSYFVQNLPADLYGNATKDPYMIVRYLNDNIRIVDGENYYKTPLTPKGVNELKVSDTWSRAICFVAICRTMGIPARLEPGSNVPQYFFDSVWNDVYFADQEKPMKKRGYLKLISKGTDPVPEYYIHFTLAKLENGRYNTLEYDYNKRINDFSNELMLTPGKYMLVTGNRINDSKILSSLFFFDLSENQHKTLDIKLRKDTSSQ